MAIPDYQTVMLPLLQYASDKQEHSLRDAIIHISDLFKLSDEERKALLPSATQEIIDNRVGWARTYLKKAGFLDDPKRGYFQITDRGSQYLATKPKELNVKILKQYPEFITFQERKNTDETTEHIETNAFPTPTEAIAYGVERIHETLADDILSLVKKCSPSFFERLVVDLLVTMGYGGSLRDAGQVIGKPGDEGIDGIIKEDKLGLDTIYIQAKRWENVVGRPEIQKFVGALAGKKAKKGIFITTARFTQDACDYADNLDIRLVLIDGLDLSKLMIEHNVGVSVTERIEIKKVNSDYFEE
jgi:restriction system protein